MRALKEFRRDDRAIEGLPIRLVVGVVVGVAALGIMLNMLSGVSGLAVSEVDVQPHPEVVAPGSNNTSVTVRAVGPDGEGVADATVVAQGGSARLEKGVLTDRTNGTGHANFTLAPSLGPNQVEGTVEFAVKPPAEGTYVDRRENTALLVVED